MTAPVHGLIGAYDRCLGVRTPTPTIHDVGTLLSARLPAAGLAIGAVAATEAASDRYRAAVGLAAHASPVRPDRVAASVAGDRMLRIDGRPVDGFAALSGFFGTADGWVRTHANYPHHRNRLLRMLGLPQDTDRELLASTFASLGAREVEDRAATAGAIAVAVRDEHEWATSAAGTAAASGPLVRVRMREPARGVAPVRDATPLRPLAGVRVLDLTRVIAGPVATRTLALFGANVLRIDPAHLDEITSQHLDNGHGKTTARLALRTMAGRDRFVDLLAGADVLVTGYRPGSLEALGVGAAAERPGLVRARVSAWGSTGPWAYRRGFDSIVQAASGIAVVEGGTSDDRGRPGRLPAQVLDHASGYLLAAAVLDALAFHAGDGAGRDIEVSLARTAAWLLASPHRCPGAPPATLPDAATTTTRLPAHGRVTTARPALAGYDDYPTSPRPWGRDEPAWQ